jgi:hypothetical protein
MKIRHPKKLLKKKIISDELGTLIAEYATAFEASLSWEDFISKMRHTCHLSPGVNNLDNPACHLLHAFRKRAPVATKSSPWSNNRIQAALKRGPHKSASLDQAFLRSELASVIRKGHWTVLPVSLVRHLRNLRISPVGIVLQRDRRPRTIIDYTLYDVDNDTSPLAPGQSMQFGRALNRILRTILDANPRFGHVYLSKVDIADGFYRILILTSDIPKLGVVLLQQPGEEQLIGFPLALPMDWVNSPPYVCAATDIVADLANRKLTSSMSSPPPPQAGLHLRDSTSHRPSRGRSPPFHRHRSHRGRSLRRRPIATNPSATDPVVAKSTCTPCHNLQTRFNNKPVAAHDLYMEDFVSMVQGNYKRRRQAKRSLLHSLNEVFRALHLNDHASRQESASIKNFLKGDGNWATQKVVLGWLLETFQQTIDLPPYRVDRLLLLLSSITPGQR